MKAPFSIVTAPPKMEPVSESYVFQYLIFTVSYLCFLINLLNIGVRREMYKTDGEWTRGDLLQHASGF